MRRALVHNAAAVIFTHNHPSGVAEPSHADHEVTGRLANALATVDDQVLDHLVVGDGETVSLAVRVLAAVHSGSTNVTTGVVRDFAEVFVVLQIERQEADYALDMDAYRKSDVLRRIASAEQAISRFEQADVEAKRGFAAHVLFRQRSP